MSLQVTSSFASNKLTFAGQTSATYYGMVNNIDVMINLRIVNNADGSTLNSMVPKVVYGNRALALPSWDTVVTADIGTLTHKCGITGKADGRAKAGYVVFQNKWIGAITVWQDSMTDNAADISLPACPSAKMKLAAGGEENAAYVAFRAPGSVTISNTSEVVGSYSCDWLVDGGSTSTSCSNVVLSSPDTGSHSVKLTVTDADANQSVVTGAFYVAPPCSSSGDTLTTLRASQTGSEFVQRSTSSLIEPCGTYTSPPGSGGGQPSEPPGGGQNCHWVRDFKYWPDGSWEWLTPWYNSCDGEVIRAAIQTVDFVAPASVRARIFGTGPLRSGRHILIERDSSSQFAVSISVDTTAAGPLDIADALQAASRLARLSAPKGKSSFGAIIPDSFLKRRYQYSTEYVKASTTLRDLKRAPEALSKRDGRARYIDVQLDR